MKVWCQTTFSSPAARKVFLLSPEMPPSIHLLFLLFSVFLSGTRGAVLGKPEIYPNQEELIVDVGKPLNLTCRAAHPVAWCSDHKFTTENYEELYEEGHDKPYISTLTIDTVNTSHVGYFSCVFNTSDNRETRNCNENDPSITSLYLYVKDLKHLMVKLDNNMVLHTPVGNSTVLPCKPTFPQVNITLSKNYEPYACENNCSFDPRKGYTVRIEEKYNAFACIGTYNDLDWANDLYVRGTDRSYNVHCSYVNALLLRRECDAWLT